MWNITIIPPRTARRKRNSAATTFIKKEGFRTMKKILALTLALSMMLGLAPTALAEGGDKVTLDVIISQYGNYTQDWWKEFEAAFEEANTDIDLNIEIVSWNDLYTVVNTRISTNQAPDILNIDTFADYVADDLLMPAEDYTSDELKAKILPSFWNANEMDGTVWALPILASVRALFYNQDILDAAGAKAPATWDEVLAACEAIKAYDENIVPWSLDISTDEGQAAFSYYTWNDGGGFVDADGNWALNSAANVEAVEFMKTLIDSGYCTADPYTETRYPQQDAFAAGSLAMMLGPCNLYDLAPDINFAVAPMPTKEEGAAPVQMGVCDRLMAFVDEDAEDQDARTDAISRFFDAFYEADTYAGYMVFEGFLPVTSDAADILVENAEQYEKGGGAGAGNSDYFDSFCTMLSSCNFYPTAKPEWNDVKQGVINAEQQICQGADAQSTLDALQEEILALAE